MNSKRERSIRRVLRKGFLRKMKDDQGVNIARQFGKTDAFAEVYDFSHALIVLPQLRIDPLMNT